MKKKGALYISIDSEKRLIVGIKSHLTRFKEEYIMIPRFKLWAEVSEQSVMGEGRYSLLKEIQKSGSLSKAAKHLKMSYGHAHQLIRDLNQRLGFIIIEPAVGGKKGGGMRVTERGKDLLQWFEDLTANVEKLLQESPFEMSEFD